MFGVLAPFPFGVSGIAVVEIGDGVFTKTFGGIVMECTSISCRCVVGACVKSM